MQITELDVRGLFGRYDHRVKFPLVEAGGPSVAILYGINGVGKTTLLKFLDAFLREERGGRWDIFRAVPFRSCTLSLSEIPPIKVWPGEEHGHEVLYIEFDKEKVVVRRDSNIRGGISEEENLRARALSDRYQEARRELSFQFVETARLATLDEPEDDETESLERTYRRALRAREALGERKSLSVRMREFIAQAQLDYRTYFSSTGTEVFEQIIDRLTSPTSIPHDEAELMTRLERVSEQHNEAARFELEQEEWDYHRLLEIIRQRPPEQEVEGRERTLGVIAQYVEMLEARAARRELLAERLSTFEQVMKDFFFGKDVSVTASGGIRISTEGESPTLLAERSLSSGERHLLYLMASAVTTRRKGTVLAIDEPEMSMHVAWQRKLIAGLLKCAARAEPQFIFASHSPEVIADYQDRLIELPSPLSDASA